MPCGACRRRRAYLAPDGLPSLTARSAKGQERPEALHQAVEGVRHCKMCNGFSEDELCATCSSSRRDASILCVVETPADQNMIEACQGYHGLYYVLMGRLAPLEGVGPDQLQFDRLLQRACEPAVHEVILATNFTPEGETTAHYLSELLRARGRKVSRLARGVPAGSELDMLMPAPLPGRSWAQRHVTAGQRVHTVF